MIPGNEYIPTEDLKLPDEDKREKVLVFFQKENPIKFTSIERSMFTNAWIIAKSVKGREATLLDIETILNNYNNEGKRMLREMRDTMHAQFFAEIYSFMISDYYTQLSGERNHTMTYEKCSNLRAAIASKLCDKKYMQALLEDAKIKEELRKEKEEKERIDQENIKQILSTFKDNDYKNLVLTMMEGFVNISKDNKFFNQLYNESHISLISLIDLMDTPEEFCKLYKISKSEDGKFHIAVRKDYIKEIEKDPQKYLDISLNQIHGVIRNDKVQTLLENYKEYIKNTDYEKVDIDFNFAAAE